MDLRIDRQALIPVVQQIASAVMAWARGGGGGLPGTRLPSVRQLARENLLSQSVVMEALDRLVAQGVLEARHGSGFFVAQLPAADRLAEERGAYEGPEGGWRSFADGATGELRLGCGWIPETWRETDDIGYAIRQVTRTEMAGLFNYSPPLGLPGLRKQISKRLGLFNLCVSEEQILTTQGASHALDLVVRTLLNPGDTVLVESPGYGNIYQLLALRGVIALEVPRLPSGPDLDVLETLLAKHQPTCLFINSLYHNPTGSCLTSKVALSLLALAEHHDFLIVEDDVYADLQNSTSPRLAAMASGERVIYISSFSKTLSCSLRVGFMCASSALIARLAEVKMITSVGTSRFSECVLAILLTNGAYRKLVQRLRQRLNGNMEATLRVLDQTGWEVFTDPVGGMFIWARSELFDFAQLQVQARRFGVCLTPGSAFYPQGQVSPWLRINVAYAADPRALAFFRAAGSAGSTSTVLKATLT